MKDKMKKILRSSLSFLPDKQYCQLTFILRHKRVPNLKNPVFFNDKMLYLKLNNRNPLSKTLADKYEVRHYIKTKIGEEYLIPLIGVYDSIEQVQYNDLPNKFALKPTTGAQHNLICTNKSLLDWKEVSKEIKNMFKVDYYRKTREWQYKDLPKRFVIEEFIEDTNGNTYDYKFWCFNGKVKMVQVNTDRFSKHKKTIFDREFNIIDLKINNDEHNLLLKKPKNYDLMIELAEKLSTGFSFLRVDLYNIEGKIYFGELTFYPDNCHAVMDPPKYEKILGDMVKL